MTHIHTSVGVIEMFIEEVPVFTTTFTIFSVTYQILIPEYTKTPHTMSTE